MPKQTRKRKTQEKNDNTEKKINKSGIENLLEDEKNNNVPENKLRRKSKRKANDKNTTAEIKSVNISSIDQDNLPLTKKPKLKKAKVTSNSNVPKNKLNNTEILNDSSNSVDSEVKLKTQDSPKIEALEVHVKAEPSHSKNDESSSSSESEWEEVEDHIEPNLDDYKPDIPKEGVEITIDCPELRIKKRTKKEFDENEWIRLYINRERKEIQLNIHKTHLLCLLAHGMYVNSVLNSDSVKAIALSLIPSDIFNRTSGKKIDKIDIDSVETIISWFRDSFTFEDEKPLFKNIVASLIKGFQNGTALNASEYNLLFIVIARLLGFKVRFCISLYPISYKATNLIKKPNSKRITKSSKKHDAKMNGNDINDMDNKTSGKKCESSKKEKKCKNKPLNQKKIKNKNLDKNRETNEESSRPKRSDKKNYKLSSDDNSDEDKNDEDFEIHDDSSDEDVFKPVKVPRKSKEKSNHKILSSDFPKKSKEKTKEKSNRKILSSDSEPPSPSSPAGFLLDEKNIVCWAEIFLKSIKQWVSIECANNIVNKPYDIEMLLPKPVSYILAYDDKSHVKDVTRRYCNEYMTSTIKLRVDPEWWEDALDPFLPPNSKLDKDEEKNLDEILVNKPLPHTIQGFKNHPLYALKRHLLKFEAIYPPDAPPVGFIRGEPVYARDSVCQLHSRETWLKEARVVRIGEKPYKIVKARPKWDKIAGVMRTDLPLEVFGFWQTEPYEPPVAVNGKVPRNEYGNVELFKPSMLPKGTVHLQLPGLNRIAKKLGIDCSPAVTGFDGHKGSVHPVFDGFVICEEFKDTILDAWNEEQDNIRKREEEKREKRIYGNWKKLIRGLLIRERIKLKYEQN